MNFLGPQIAGEYMVNTCWFFMGDNTSVFGDVIGYFGGTCSPRRNNDRQPGIVCFWRCD
jgi:hypothetical protein